MDTGAELLALSREYTETFDQIHNSANAGRLISTALIILGPQIEEMIIDMLSPGTPNIEELVHYYLLSRLFQLKLEETA